MVDVLSESTSFSSRDGRRIVPCSVMMVNFRRLRTTEEDGAVKGKKETRFLRVSLPQVFNPGDLFHSMVALYSAALPDMELEAIYDTINNKPSRTVFVMAKKEAVLTYRKEHGPPKPIKDTKVIENNEKKEKSSDKENTGTSKVSTLDGEEEEDPYCSLFSDEEEEEYEEEVGDGEEEKGEDFELEREKFLSRVKERQSMDPFDLASVGMEDQITGCATFMKLSSKPGDSSVQILLLAVRHRWRGCGIGEYLLRLCKDPSIVGQYDLILTYADHKAEGFFSQFGFTADPIITARHKSLSDYWENSTLMAYVPPYSAAVSGSLKSLEAMEGQIKTWRVMSMASHYEQVCIMERLRQEVFLLYGRIASQEEVIQTLHTELRESVMNRQALEKEFELYRTKMKEKMLLLMEGRAKTWLEQLETRNEKERAAPLIKVTATFNEGLMPSSTSDGLSSSRTMVPDESSNSGDTTVAEDDNEDIRKGTE
ncbi:PREDICTED: uncharacterized protein LOC105312367 [Amphimedon queenslandica]|uniref:N-acetyltransferase domain-containing protein n=1 Tax=Amphimedon queenslandica TaxID=400682 RepID=A0A1X7V464_AMPQE|nr:PREDICTED: uncharacterized protein LOC105312367 [Amphimedon queenslandica]|eukprot:XP_011403257.1 PREDICTED: uncharacterized protein LOC105312367 [Amphimedon queenslandica]